MYLSDVFYIDKTTNVPVKLHVREKCHFKNLKLHGIARNEFNLCGIFGVPVKMNLNIAGESALSSKKMLCRFPNESLKLLKKNIPTNKHVFLGLRE
jgi:hypothetical protein